MHGIDVAVVIVTVAVECVAGIANVSTALAIPVLSVLCIRFAWKSVTWPKLWD